MEPETVATPPATSSDPILWSTSLEPTPASVPLEDETTETTFETHAPHAVTNGHAMTNGHSHLNGHSHHAPNGDAPSHVHTHGGHRAHWALIAPARATLVGGYAPALPRTEAAGKQGLYLRFAKRLFDIVGAIVALIVTAPLVIVAAILIKLESRGPVLYKSTRIGRGGRPFTFLKLRSMVDGADRHRRTLSHLNECDGPVFKICRDPRITRIGRFLRTTSIDEIPQFLNVLRGEMSLVGPRPPIPEEVAQYEPWQMRRLDVRPGITCLWQISGRSRVGFQEWMRLDLEYIKHQSFWLDMKILARTVPAVLSREGAY